MVITGIVTGFILMFFAVRFIGVILQLLNWLFWTLLAALVILGRVLLWLLALLAMLVVAPFRAARKRQ